MNILISLILAAGFYNVEYRTPENITKTDRIKEEKMTIRFDREYDCEYYDPNTLTLHLSPGRLL